MSFEYDLYLERHRANVRRGFAWLRSNLPDFLEKADDPEWYIYSEHDASKNDPIEYSAYDAYFYGGNRSYAVVQDFKIAWLHHLHNNPHHWQYWVLINDEPDEGQIALKMPYHYILEMICDWWSFSWSSGNPTEIFEWYERHRDYMLLHENTRKTVEDILSRIADKLDETEELCHHGIKGQKWGVRNGPPYPLDRSTEADTTVKNAIESGEVSAKINREKQMRHTKSNHLPGRSYLDGDLEYAQELVDRHSGKGEAIMDSHGNWTNKEKFDDSDIIGTHVDVYGMETKTNKGVIAYSKTGTHVYPRKER